MYYDSPLMGGETVRETMSAHSANDDNNQNHRGTTEERPAEAEAPPRDEPSREPEEQLEPAMGVTNVPSDPGMRAVGRLAAVIQGVATSTPEDLDEDREALALECLTASNPAWGSYWASQPTHAGPVLTSKEVGPAVLTPLTESELPRATLRDVRGGAYSLAQAAALILKQGLDWGASGAGTSTAGLLQLWTAAPVSGS